MISVNLALPMAKRKIKTLSAISEATGISRATLSSLHTEKAHGIQFKTLDTLCRFLECNVGDLLECMPDEHVMKEAN